MVDDVDDVRGGEVLQDGDDDGAVGDRGQIGDAPSGVVTSDQGDFVALFDAGLFEEQVEFGDLLGHFVIGEGLVLEIVGQSRHFAVFAETLFVYFQ